MNSIIDSRSANVLHWIRRHETLGTQRHTWKWIPRGDFVDTVDNELPFYIYVACSATTNAIFDCIFACLDQHTTDHAHVITCVERTINEFITKQNSPVHIRKLQFVKECLPTATFTLGSQSDILNPNKGIRVTLTRHSLKWFLHLYLITESSCYWLTGLYQGRRFNHGNLV